ncbi:hypothetical protein K3495_g4182 [Podosphaera aphanis]|nr:hypothetical protein K3495_g4182 [Podosphaera aphanis]
MPLPEQPPESASPAPATAPEYSRNSGYSQWLKSNSFMAWPFQSGQNIDPASSDREKDLTSETSGENSNGSNNTHAPLRRPSTSSNSQSMVKEAHRVERNQAVVTDERNSVAEVESLRVAMNEHFRLNPHLDKTIWQEREDKKLIPEILVKGGNLVQSHITKEEVALPALEEGLPSPIPSELETRSTGSSYKTARAEPTPMNEAIDLSSFPFPKMLTSEHLNIQKKLGENSEASTLVSQSSAACGTQNNFTFESPNIDQLSLMLSSEPGLQPWWTTLVEIMKNIYGAQRVTLSVPADSTDIENVPWGQKATFNMARDESEMKILPKKRSTINCNYNNNTSEISTLGETSFKEDLWLPESQVTNNTRPGLPNRHSFVAHEENKQTSTSTSEANKASSSRPSSVRRSKSHLIPRPGVPPRSGTLQNAQLNLKSLEDHLIFGKSHLSEIWNGLEQSNRGSAGRVFSVLQALDCEADALIDNKGISRVIQRGKVVALTRDYPYIDSSAVDEKGENWTYQGSKKTSVYDKARLSSIFGHRSSKTGRGSTRNPSVNYEPEPETNYDEYEQATASPWSQSPAPSPAVHAETTENIFFANVQPVDEETFNPQRTPPNYSEGPQPETIGADRSWTVLHVPLIHPLLSKPVQTFRLDAAALESRSAGLKKNRVEKYPEENRRQPSRERRSGTTPIAILSLLTPLIPYPSELRNSLESLAPHLATTFSLCRNFSNLETEIAGLTRKRPTTTGFGAVVPAGFRCYPEDPLHLGPILQSPVDGSSQQRSTGGSITSSSEYSGQTQSNLGSTAGTPGWDPGNGYFYQDKRSSVGSPGYFAAESYFSSRERPLLSRLDSESTGKARNFSKEFSPTDTRLNRIASDIEEISEDACHPGDLIEKLRKEQGLLHAIEQESQERLISKEIMTNVLSSRETGSSYQLSSIVSSRKSALRAVSQKGSSKVDRHHSAHTLLHSYGADFGATFQSLPATCRSRTSMKPKTRNRSSSASDPPPPDYMPPPSDRVKGILLDSLPLHLFISLPSTGEIVWVNSRYLTYRGQSVENLHENPWSSIHPEERELYLKSWKHALRTGEQFAMQARLKRFDGTYRWFYTRASGLRDSRGVVVQWHGTSMDIHEQHVAEVKAARQEEIEASEAKHRQLANLIPQIIFSATEENGLTFANQQWLSYTGQPLDDSIGLGFVDFVHPEDLAKCNVLIAEPPVSSQLKSTKIPDRSQAPSLTPTKNKLGPGSTGSESSDTLTETPIKNTENSLSRTNSSSSTSIFECPSADMAELIRSGVVKLDKDSNGQISYSTEVRLRSKSGEYRWHLVRFVEVDNINLCTGDGSWFGACADINDHKLLEMKLKEAMESKSKFLSNMSHEIRTPLIGISGMISFLQDTVLNEEQMDYCNTISSSAQGLLAIINDILDLAKADAGMIKLVFDWFHVRSLVEEVNETLSTMAITKHLDVNYVVDVDVPEMVKGDRFRIRQALLNVIGNAIKFTTVGEVFTRCKISSQRDQAYQVGENELMLEFSITDTGKGFTQEEAEIIFKPFSQIDSSSTRTQGGTGLGLVISRQLIELHGGKMEGTAVPGVGSTFTFTAVFGLATADDHPDSLTSLAPTTTDFGMIRNRSSRQNSISTQIQDHETRKSHATFIQSKDSTRLPAQQSLKGVNLLAGTSSTSSTLSTCSSRSIATSLSSSSSSPESSTNFRKVDKEKLSDSSLKLIIPDQHTKSRDTNFDDALCGTNNMDTTLNINMGSSTQPKNICSPMYSILLICPQKHSREATTHHIEMTLSKDVPHQIIALSSVEEVYDVINTVRSLHFSHIVINLGSTDEIVNLINRILAISHSQPSIVILSDPLQRQEVMEKSAGFDYVQLAKENRIIFIFKPVKPSRFAVIFDPEKERDLSTDRNRHKAQQQVETQRQNYVNIGKRLGNKGLKVLLVEDNATNQKVLLKYLGKVGLAVDLALDGAECTEKVFSNPHSFYSLILCDLHMPNKDGYQACREIREWEQRKRYKPLPIIALSANVMTDVLDRCNEAGFSNYITKPVDFKALSAIMGDLLDPDGATN